MTRFRVVTCMKSCRMGWKKPQIPPLRYAPVGMTRFRVVTCMKSCRMGWKKQQIPPLRYAPVGMTRFRVVTCMKSCRMGWKKQQIPPLRYAPVGMTRFRVVTCMKSCRMGWKKPQIPPLRYAPYLSPGGGALTLAPLLGGCQPSLDGPFWKNTESLLYGPVAYIALAWPNNFPARSVSARTLSTNW